ncbi:MAG TPA: nuclear transport factor 2 family protein [Gemmatimonadaceae bacterium]|nr:nuclear transport factor 2 family protein [Gemmatimonadaceae bacterium]
MRTLLACLISFALLPSTAVSQDAAQAIRALDSAWARAYATHDTTLALQLFAEDLVVTSAGGNVKDRTGEIADVRRAPGLQLEFFKTIDAKVRVYESSAVVTGLAEWKYTQNGQVSNPRRRYTAVYVKGGPLGWRMVALHLGRAPE